MTVQTSTVRSLRIAVMSVAVAVGAHLLMPMSASALDVPPSPIITLTSATCDAPTNKVFIKMLQGDVSKYRFVLTVDGKKERLLNKTIRNALYAQELHEVEASPLQSVLQRYYGKTVGIQTYYFADKGEFEAQQETVELEVGGPLTRAVKLDEPKTALLVNPATLDCQPAVAPKLQADKLPVAPKVSLHPATCQVRHNRMTLDTSDKNMRYRFVISLGAGKIQLKRELRDALFQHKTLSLEDVVAQHYPQVKDAIPYGQEVRVQAYYFDEKAEYDASLYDTVLQLTVGASDRFIKLGEPQSAVILQQTDASCQPPVDPADPVNPAPTQPQPANPAPAVPAPVVPVTTPAVVVTPKASELLADTGEAQELYAAAGVLAVIFGVAVLRRLS